MTARTLRNLNAFFFTIGRSNAQIRHGPWPNNPHPTLTLACAQSLRIQPISTTRPLSSTMAAAAASSSSSAPVETPSNASKSGEIQAEIDALTQPPHGKWTLHEGPPRRLERSFGFADFAASWRFMDAVAAACEEKQHHPEWSNVYNTVFIRWTTHRPPGGVRKKDRDMARICDALAREHGARDVESESGQGAGEGLQGLVSEVSESAKECCASR